MKTFQIFTLGLLFLLSHQASYGVTDRDVRSFGENNEYIYPHSTNTEYDRLCIAHAHQNRINNIQAIRSNPVAIPTPKQDTDATSMILHESNKTITSQEKQSPELALANSPDSVWGWVVASWVGSNKSTPGLN